MESGSCSRTCKFQWQLHQKFTLNIGQQHLSLGGDHQETLKELSKHCDEFLVHGVDVEGKMSGIEET